MLDNNFDLNTKDDIQFCIITEDNFICRGCVHCNGCVISCSKFESRKPVSIFLYGCCADFSAKDNK